MKQATLDLIKNIDENTFVPPSTKNELFELFQLDTVADLRKVSRNFMKLYEILEHLDGQTSSATTEKAGIVKFGTETGNAIDAETWKQAIGQSLGGYVSKVESKEAGKWYINDLTDGKIYKCIQNHTSKSFDITKFVDITNVGLSDKVENLHKMGNNYIEFPDGLIIQWGENYFEGLSSTPGATLVKNINFSKTFKERCLNVQISGNYNYSDESLEAILNSSFLSKTGFTLQVMRQRGGGGGDKGGFFWQAIGF